MVDVQTHTAILNMPMQITFQTELTMHSEFSGVLSVHGRCPDASKRDTG